ncbi:MAG TPA: hypothetical protein VE487_12700 [Ilumatobacter sp.]|nr:hypothetical protein [Ilumatobacter sp.]
MRPLRAPAISLGCSYLVAIVMLGPLLGSTADASTAFAEHFDDAVNRRRDVLGSLALLVTAATLVWTAVTARQQTTGHPHRSTRDLSTIASTVTASALVTASGLLMTVPLSSSIGELTDDPGIDVGVQAGIAQAGTVMLLVAALSLAVTAVLLARLGRQAHAIPRWISATAWVTAATLALGVSIVLLVPFAAWIIALGLTWSSEASPPTRASGSPPADTTTV